MKNPDVVETTEQRYSNDLDHAEALGRRIIKMIDTVPQDATASSWVQLKALLSVVGATAAAASRGRKEELVKAAVTFMLREELERSFEIAKMLREEQGS